MAYRISTQRHMAADAGRTLSALPYLTLDKLREPPTWQGAVQALIDGHRHPRAQIADSVLANGDRRLMARSAWIEGLGAAVKTFTVYPGNPGQQPPRPSVQGGCTLFDDGSGTPTAIVDFGLLTYWKTAADSVLGAQLVGPAEPRSLVVIGAGLVARSLCEAYAAMFPSLEAITVCARRLSAAQALVDALTLEGVELKASDEPARDVPAACVVATATTSESPVLNGDWLGAAVHVDLVGAYSATMREADDAALRRGQLYVDSRETTIDHIGELLIPIQQGVITAESVRGDYYDLLANGSARAALTQRGDTITIFKNGGGAHLDLMMSRYMQSLAAD